jgi:hypothetical protein
MALTRTFVSFSSTDVGRYHLMCAWKAHERIDFDFADFQLDEAINSKSPSYIKSVCRTKIRRADTFVLLIGADTRQKTVFVKAEVEVAIEKECRLVGVNLNNCRFKDTRCPEFFANKGAIFVPFSSRIVARALEWERETENDWYFKDHIYTNLGYNLIGNTAIMPPPVNPFASRRPPWAK